MDFRKYRPNHDPLLINGEQVETISTKFLGTHISSDLSWRATSGPWWRRLSSSYTSCVSLGRTIWIRSCCWPSITLLWRAYWHTVCGTQAPQLRTGMRPAPPKRSSPALCPLCNNWPHPAASEGQRPSQETPHTLPTTCLTCCRLGDGTWRSDPTPAD